MTTFTQEPWDVSYEALPADDEDARFGAGRIRAFKRDIRERLAVDHSTAGDASDGAHKKVTLLKQTTDPTTAVNTGFVFTKVVGAITELFWKDSSGNVVQLTSNGLIKSGRFDAPAGTRMLFNNTAAPVGWTKDTSAVLNDSMLRIVTGTVTSAGSQAFSTFNGLNSTGSTTLTEAHIPPHTHTMPLASTASGIVFGSGPYYPAQAGAGVSGATGGGIGHTHDLTHNIKYNDVIIATKD